MNDRFAMLGVSYRTADLAALEKLTLSKAEQQDLADRLLSLPEISNAAVLSTCNRTEIYVCANNELEVHQSVRGALERTVGDRFPAEDGLYHHRGEGAMHHLLRVACGLDSMVLGEAQILGQCKGAFEDAMATQEISLPFRSLYDAMLRTAKRSRAETKIGLGAVSVASAAVQLAARVYSKLDGLHVGIVGAGETGRLAAQHFNSKSPRRISIFNRTPDKAEQLASTVGGYGYGLDALGEQLSELDVIVTAASVENPIIDVALAKPALSNKRGGLVAMVDIGLPRNIAPEVGALPGVILSDIGALQAVVDENLAHRKRDVPKVETIIEDELQRFEDQRRLMSAGPMIAAMRESVHAARQEELEKWRGKLDEDAFKAADEATRAVVNKILHGPTTALRTVAKEQEHHTAVVRVIKGWFSGGSSDD